ncbi:MAG: hypothetical protein F6J90_27635 [Moorea sp. SIOASIH]|nr:hypothetical protein [Moorena sp. SIOASIH]NEO39901.1 hypothetical protein [Moorena sp. SIOASIH]
MQNYQLHRIVFLLPAPCSLLPKKPERKYLTAIAKRCIKNARTIKDEG